MKQLICEMCGSKDILKQDGVFVCQSCGCRYSVEEARKMMIEGTVDVSGSTVQVDNSGLADSYLQMAENALSAGNHAEAESYANRTIEVAPNAYRAWFIKGKAAGWQTTGINNRYPESITSWIRAYQCLPEKASEEFSSEIEAEAANISEAIVRMKINHFADYRTKDNADEVSSALSMIERQLKKLNEAIGVDVYTEEFKIKLADIINVGVVRANKAAGAYYEGRTDKTHWEQYTSAKDSCLKILEDAYTLSKGNDDLSCTICKNYVVIAEDVVSSWYQIYGDMHFFQYGLPLEEKKRRNTIVDSWKQKCNYHDPEVRERALGEVVVKIEGDIQRLEESQARTVYWEQHSDKRAAYEEEKRSLIEKIDRLKTKKEENPLYDTKQDIEDNIRELASKVDSMGFLKLKDKRILQEEIDAQCLELRRINSKICEYEAMCDERIGLLEMRVDEINNDLKMSRGRIPIAHQESPVVFVVGSEDLAMSPIEMLRYIDATLPRPYRLKTGTDADIVNSTLELDAVVQTALTGVAELLGFEPPNLHLYSDDEEDPNAINLYRMDFYSGREQTKTSLYCPARSKNTVIKKNFWFELGSEFTTKDATDFIRIISMTIFDLLPSTEIEGLQKILAAGVYGFTTAKAITSDGLKITFNRSASVTVTISQE